MGLGSRPLRRLGVAALILVAILALAPPASAASIRRGPAGERFYSPPKRLVQGRHGTVIWMRSVRTDAALSAAKRNVLVLYRSKSPSGKAIAVSGIVAIPKGTAPKRGWPVIAWAHATTGVGDRCAPSKGFAELEGRDAILNSYLRRGHAIAQTDYEGLGTPRTHPWLIGVSEGRSIIDSVHAARAIDPAIGKRWIPMGVSQGGHASLWAGGVAQSSWGKDLRLVGIAALAPSSLNAPFFQTVRGQTAPSGLTGWAATLLAGAGTTGLDVRPLLTPLGVSTWPQLQTKCYPEIKGPGSFGRLAPADILRPDADFEPLYRVLEANEPATLHLRAPVFIGQGLADTSVAPAATEHLIAQLRAHGASVDYHAYPGAQHGAPEVIASRHDVAAFAARRFAAGH